jgi:hypothetical protein
MIKRNEFAARGWERFGRPQISLDPATHQHDHANIRRRFEARTHVMSTDHFTAGSSLKTITIRLHPEAGQHAAEARYELALNALATALILVNSSVSPAWTVRPALGDEPLLYHLTPLQEHSVSIAAAWEMTEALRCQAAVAAAEPTFVMQKPDRSAAERQPPP